MQCAIPVEQGPHTFVDRQGDGAIVTFSFAFTGPYPGYIRKSDIHVFIRESDPESPMYGQYAEYEGCWEFPSPSAVTLLGDAPIAPLDGLPNVRIRRIMPKSEPYAERHSGAIFDEDNLNNSFLQQLYNQHEALDGLLGKEIDINGPLDMKGFKIVNLGDADLSEGADAVNVNTMMEYFQGQGVIGSPVIWPAHIYGTGEIVATGVDPSMGKYGINQLIQYQGKAIRFAGAPEDLPYDMSQPFDSGKWAPAYLNITNLQHSFDIVGDLETYVTPLDSLGEPYIFDVATLYINGKYQTPTGDNRVFDILERPEGLSVVLRSGSFVDGDVVTIEIAAIGDSVTASEEGDVTDYDRVARIVASQDVTEQQPLTIGTLLDNLKSTFYHQSDSIMNVRGLEGTVTDIPASFVTDGKLEVNGVTTQLRKTYFEAETELWVEAFLFGHLGTDMRPVFQAAIDYAEKSGKRTKLRWDGTMLIDSIYPGVLPSYATGKRVGLLIRKSELVWLDGGGQTIMLNSENPALQNMDAVLAIGDDVTNPERGAFMYLKDFRVEGGFNWPDINNEPKTCIDASWNPIRYSKIDNVVCRRAAESNLRIVGFVIHMEDVDCRFANMNFDVQTESLDGNTSARTGYLFDNCTANNAYLAGFSVAGASGHTYIHFNCCNADFAGRDRNGQTIVANIEQSAGYRISAGFGVTLTSCGSEWSTRHSLFNGAFGVNITNPYTKFMGSTDPGNIVQGHFMFRGHMERVHLTGYQYSSVSNTQHFVVIDASSLSSYSDSTLYKDASIPTSGIHVINYENINSLNTAALVQDVGDMYQFGMRSPARDAILLGDPILGHVDRDYAYGQYSHCSRKEFYFTTSSGTWTRTYPIAEIDDVTKNGMITFHYEILLSASFNQAPATPPAKVQGALSLNSGVLMGEDTEVFIYGTEAFWRDAGLPPGDDPVFGIKLLNSVIQLKIAVPFAGIHVIVTATGRPEVDVNRFKWRSHNAPEA